MKTIVYFFLASLALFTASCKEKDKIFYSEQNPTALNGLTDLQKEPLFSLDWINSRQIQPGENSVPEEYIEVVGWALDPDAQALASKVYVSVNGVLFSTEYGIPRDDVANYYKNPALQKCGFRAKLDRTVFIPGVYTLEVKVVGATGYFSSSAERAVTLKL